MSSDISHAHLKNENKRFLIERNSHKIMKAFNSGLKIQLTRDPAFMSLT